MKVKVEVVLVFMRYKGTARPLAPLRVNSLVLALSMQPIVAVGGKVGRGICCLNCHVTGRLTRGVGSISPSNGGVSRCRGCDGRGKRRLSHVSLVRIAVKRAHGRSGSRGVQMGLRCDRDEQRLPALGLPPTVSPIRRAALLGGQAHWSGGYARHVSSLGHCISLRRPEVPLIRGISIQRLKRGTWSGPVTSYTASVSGRLLFISRLQPSTAKRQNWSPN